jgi:hypothetical protein
VHVKNVPTPQKDRSGRVQTPTEALLVAVLMPLSVLMLLSPKFGTFTGDSFELQNRLRYSVLIFLTNNVVGSHHSARSLREMRDRWRVLESFASRTLLYALCARHTKLLLTSLIQFEDN